MHAKRIFASAMMLWLAACGPRPDPATIRPVGEITVDDNLTMARMIAAGHYDVADKSITPASFPIARKDSHKEEMWVIAFNRSVTSAEAQALITARKEIVRPANLDECLAYGAALEKARLSYDLARPNREITCLGQSALKDSARSVPVIWSVSNGAWDLGLNSWDTRWNARRRFLIVAKQ